jgi:hypothetical protein
MAAGAILLHEALADLRAATLREDRNSHEGQCRYKHADADRTSSRRSIGPVAS